MFVYFNKPSEGVSASKTICLREREETSTEVFDQEAVEIYEGGGDMVPELSASHDSGVLDMMESVQCFAGDSEYG